MRSLEQHVDALLSYDYSAVDDTALRQMISDTDDRRIWTIAEAMRRGMSGYEIHMLTKIDEWFIKKIGNLLDMEQRLSSEPMSVQLLRAAKHMEYPDGVIAKLSGMTEDEVYAMRMDNKITAGFKMVDTCAAEFDAMTPYYYSDYGVENEALPEETGKKKVLILGSGPIRIGQGIEFDFCSVHSTWAFAKEGYETIIINNNP